MMTEEAPGASLPALEHAYVVTIIETYCVEADDEAEAVRLVVDLHHGTTADTFDVQIEEKGA